MYFYVNQTNYPHVSYPTMTDIPELERKDSTVRTAGPASLAAAISFARSWSAALDDFPVFFRVEVT